MQPAIEFDQDGWATEKPHVKCCKMPFQVSSKEQEIYKTLLHGHCQHKDKKSEDHQCCGAMTITENALVLRCKKCGDAKGEFK